MMVLGIETSCQVGGIAISRDFQVLAEHTFPRALDADARLVPTLDRLRESLSFHWSDIDLLAVDIGPGSYTGLRVGLATVKALAYPSGKPIVAVTSFDILVEGAEGHDAAYLCPLVEAHRKEVYAALYSRSQRIETEESSDSSDFCRRWQLASEFMVTRPEELIEKLPAGAAVLGSGMDKYAQAFQSKGIRCLARESWIPRAGVVAQLGEWEYRRGKQVSIHELEPLYLRIPQAEERWQERIHGQQPT